MHRIKIVFTFIFILFSGLLFSQTNSDSTFRQKLKKRILFEFEEEYGGIISNKDARETTFKDATYNGVNFRIGWQTQKSDDIYHQLYNYPVYGIGVYSSTFNVENVGSPYAVYGFVQVPIKPKELSKWSYDYRISLGLSGNFKPFDAETNPVNIVIGTKNNVFIDLGIRAAYRITPKFKAGVGLAFHHFSNGAMRLPNKGINLIPLTASITYIPFPDQLDKSKVEVPPVPEQVFYHFNVAAGAKQVNRNMQKRYFKSTISAYASKHVSHKWRIGGGLDLFYSESGSDDEIAGEDSGKLSSKLSGGPALYIAHVLNKNLILNGNIGAYVHRQNFNGETQLIYLRAGARYYVYKNLNAGVSIKAHMGKADYIEWSLGYTLNRDK